MAFRPRLVLVLIAAFAFVGWSAARAEEANIAAANSAAASEARLIDSVRLLASDAWEGRGVGTEGLDKAADYIVEQFAALGLRTDVVDGKPFQKFTATVGTELGKPNDARFVDTAKADGAKTIALDLGKTFTPLSIGGSGKLDVPLVFAGYGITAKDLDYDDYADLDVKDKAVIVFRHEPQQSNPHSAFDGTQHSQYAPFTRKVSNAFEHSASAVIFVTDEHEIQQRIEQRKKLFDKAKEELAEARKKFKSIDEPTADELDRHKRSVEQLKRDVDDQKKKLDAERDPLLGFRAAGSSGDAGRIPVLTCRRSVIDELLRSAIDTDLNSLEKQIDEGPKPASRELTGWRLTGDVHVERTRAEIKNVIAVLEGDGPHADETIVIGAHYDHLGWGGEGSFVPDKKEIHNGADDNASGTSALLEVARRLATRSTKLPRRVVFIAFTGEERGLLGSARYCAHPIYPLDKTVAMLNMDMVGRLEDDKLNIQGIDTAKEFGAIVDRLNESLGFKIARQSGGFGPSDHSSFYAHKIPVMHFFTGLHKDYHRPTDDIEKINVAGMRKVVDLVTDVTIAIAEADARPTYQAAKEKKSTLGGGGDRPYFGSIPDFAQEESGYKLSGVTKDGPADKAGIRAGDIIIRLGDSQIGNLEDFDSALRKFKAADKVPVIVKRGGEEVTVTVTLDPPK